MALTDPYAPDDDEQVKRQALLNQMGPGDGANDYENLFRATKAGPYSPVGPTPQEPTAPVQPIGGGVQPRGPGTVGLGGIPPTYHTGGGLDSFDPSSDTPTASPAQPANPTLPGPTSPAPSAPAAPTAPTTGWQTPGSGDTGNDWLGFLQQFLGRNMVSRGGSQGGYFEGGNQYRGNLQAVVDAYNQAKGAHAAVAGDDKIDFGDGRGPQDVITGAGDFWYGGPPGSMQPGSGGGGAGGSGAGAPGAPSAPGAPGSGGSGGPLDDLFRQTLIQQMQGANAPIDDSTPGISQPFNAANLASQRGLDQERKMLAEEAFAGSQGGPIDRNALSMQGQQAAERQGTALAGLKANLYTQEIQRRHQQLSHALDLANAVGARTEAAQLQRQLAQMESQYRYAALGQNQSQFEDMTANQWAQWLANFNRDNTIGAMRG